MVPPGRPCLSCWRLAPMAPRSRRRTGWRARRCPACSEELPSFFSLCQNHMSRTASMATFRNAPALARRGPRQQRLAAAGRPVEQDAAGLACGRRRGRPRAAGRAARSSSAPGPSTSSRPPTSAKVTRSRSSTVSGFLARLLRAPAAQCSRNTLPASSGSGGCSRSSSALRARDPPRHACSNAWRPASTASLVRPSSARSSAICSHSGPLRGETATASRRPCSVRSKQVRHARPSARDSGARAGSA